MTEIPIQLYKFRFLFRAKEKMNLPRFKGSMFRGAFGWTLKNALCITKQSNCDNCILKENCGYFQIFETEIPEHNLDFLKGVKKSPHPFVIEPPLDNKNYFEENDFFELGLVIIGEAVKFLPFFVYTFQKMGERGIGFRRGKFDLISVANVGVSGISHEIYHPKTNILKLEYEKITDEEILKNKKSYAEKITLNFLSPVRLQKYGKKIMNRNDLTPEIFRNAFERRIYSVSHLFCGGNARKLSEKEPAKFQIAENKLNYIPIKRYSNRQKTEMEFGGFTGEIAFEGELTEILPLIFLGEQLHVGKNTVFGLGKYVIER